MVWTSLGYIDRGEPEPGPPPEPDCENGNPDTRTMCDRPWHADDLHWHEAEEGDPLPLLRIEWHAEVWIDDGRPDPWAEPRLVPVASTADPEF